MKKNIYKKINVDVKLLIKPRPNRKDNWISTRTMNMVTITIPCSGLSITRKLYAFSRLGWKARVMYIEKIKVLFPTFYYK